MSLIIPPEWAVFPLHGFTTAAGGRLMCGCGKVDCANWGKHPKWLYSQLTAGEKAPIDLAAGDGIGLCTGERSGVVLIDLDYKPAKSVNGLEEFARLCGGTVPVTLMVATPSGGFHFYFKWPGWRVKNSVSALGPGIDVRGDGGYAVLPPTRHKNGGVYEFVNWGVEVAALPDWLAGRLVDTPGGALGAPYPVPPRPVDLPENSTSEEGWKVIDRATAALAKVPEGRRNASLFAVCATLGDWNHIGEISLDDARNAILPILETLGWGDSAKTVDTMERGFAKGRSKERTMVVICPDHEDCNNQAIPALALRDDVYVVGNRLARDTGGNGIAAMEQANLQEILSRCVDWRQRAKEGELKRAHPPEWAVREIYARGYWEGLRVVEGFSEVPVLRPDGTIATEAGYDDVTRVVLKDTYKVDLMTVEEAKALLDDVFADFPFAMQAHRSALMCALLTPLAVHAFTGPIPLFLFEASKAGSGKSLMASVASLISSGSIPSVTMFTDNDEEMRKKITSIAQKPRPVALLDNVGKGVRLGGPSLCAVLTSPDRMWSDRLLGGNVQFEGKLNSVFYATSNQTELAEDMHRRVCPVRLVPDVERPEQREGFRHAYLLEYVTEYKGLLTSAALTLLASYISQGRPDTGGKPWGSFHAWHRLIVGCVMWAGYGAPDAAVEALRDSGSQDAEDGPELVLGLGELMAGQGHVDRGMTVQEVLEAIHPKGVIMGQPLAGGGRLRAFLDSKFPKGCNSRLLGVLFRDYKDQVFSGQTIKLGAPVNGYKRWKVR